VTALSNSFCIILVACACLIRCFASVTNIFNFFATLVLFTLTAKALNSFAKLVILSRVLSSSSSSSVTY
jgi:hypothetical protein